MRRVLAFPLRLAAAALVIVADQLAPPVDDDRDFLDEMIAERTEQNPDFPELMAEHELPWPDRRPICVNYPHEAYYASE